MEPNKCAIFEAPGGVEKAIASFFREKLGSGVFGGVMLPMRVPAGDSYAWVMITDPALVDQSRPIAPVMAVQGAKALRSYARRGGASFEVAALLRPCEMRAATELVKLNQIDSTRVTFFTYDCPGAVPMKAYNGDPEHWENSFADLDNMPRKIKPECGICDRFTMVAADVHFGLYQQEGKVLVIPQTEKGKALLDDSGLNVDQPLDDWQKAIDGLKARRQENREKTFEELRPKATGFKGLLSTFAHCIACRNCQAVCPICYCRQCYFESGTSKPSTAFQLKKISRRGGVSYPADKIMFHIGRMAHMSASCVSCGMCTDACPVAIPVGKVFSLAGASTQSAFEYEPGKSDNEPLPMRDYRLDELAQVRELLRGSEPGEGGHE